MDRSEWIAACAHQLQRRWRTVDPEVLEEVAADLWADVSLRVLPPIKAATEWLEPVAPPPRPAPNGILARIPGDYISRGLRSLPEPEADQPEAAQTVVDVAGLGRVRITYQLAKARHRGKAAHCFWNACHAEALE